MIAAKHVVCHGRQFTGWITGALVALAMFSEGQTHAAPGSDAIVRPTNLGVTLANTPQGLFVADVTSASPFAGLRMADRITAVNGRRVPTSTAFLNRLAATRFSGHITVIRDGQRQTLAVGGVADPSAAALAATAPANAITNTRSSVVNPANLVITSQGVMHRDAAARLGLSGTPFPTTQFPAGIPTGPTSSGTGLLSARPGVMAGGAVLNPAQMVITSQGVMHRDAAARLGLSSTPFQSNGASGLPTGPAGTVR
jgi:hypothetical protein